MKYKINQCLSSIFGTWFLNLCGCRAGVTNKKGFPSGVWTEKWKVLRELDSSSSLAAIVLSRNRDLSNQTQTCVTATLEVHEEEKKQQPQHARIWCRQLWKTPHTFTGFTEFSRSWVMSEPRYSLELMELWVEASQPCSK